VARCPPRKLYPTTDFIALTSPLEKYFGIPLPWYCRTDPIDFGNDPSKVKELILANCKEVEKILNKIGKRKQNTKHKTQNTKQKST